MARDSLYGERIIWTGRPKSVRPSALHRASAGLCFTTAAISLLFAVVTSLSLRVTPTSSLLFAFWTTVLGIAFRTVPRMLMERARYVVTEHHVLVQFGPFRRSMQRGSISFARIFWDADQPDTGDLELVRAVPTGALRRRLMLRLPGVAAPDRVWAIVRGAEDLAPLGNADMPIGQRLDRGERVIWSAQPRQQLRAFLPQGQRQWLLLAISGFTVLAGMEMVVRAIKALTKVVHSGLSYLSPSFMALAAGIFMAVALVLVVGAYIAYDTVIRPGKLVGDTRYLITDKRVLIQRRGEELHVDRSKIVDVIDAPAGDGLSMSSWCSTARRRVRSRPAAPLARCSAARTCARCSKPSRTRKARGACCPDPFYRTLREPSRSRGAGRRRESASRQRWRWRTAFGAKRSFCASADGRYCSQLSSAPL